MVRKGRISAHTVLIRKDKLKKTQFDHPFKRTELRLQNQRR